MKRTVCILTALLTVSLLMLGGCTPASDSKEADANGNAQEQAPPGAETKLDAIKNAGVITMYTNAEFPPYEFMDNNEIMGVDIEIGKAIAEKIGVELNIENAEFGGIVASIASGKGDMAISGITINEERKQSVDFSVPYVDSVQYLILPAESDINVLEDLEGKFIGAQTGTTGAMLVEDEILEGVLEGKNTELKNYTSAPSAMQDMVSGRLDAIIIDELVAISLANENSDYKAIPCVFASGAPVTEQFGVAVQKGNADLLELIDEVVSQMVQEGKIEELVEQFSQE